MNSLKTIVVLIAAAVVMSSAASPVRSNLGDVNAEFAEGGLENPYITDGLIAHWDGIWNAGIGLHDSNAAVWKDLAGVQGDMPIPSNLTVGDDSLYTDSRQVINMRNLVSSDLAEAINSGAITVEFVGRMFCEDGNYNDPVMSVYHSSNCRPLTIQAIAAISGQQRRCRMSLRAVDGRFTGSNAAIAQKGGHRSSFSVAWDGETIIQYINGTYNWSGSIPQYESANATTQMHLRLLNIPTNTTGIDLEVCRISIYGKVLSEDEVLHNHLIDKERFGL